MTPAVVTLLRPLSGRAVYATRVLQRSFASSAFVRSATNMPPPKKVPSVKASRAAVAAAKGLNASGTGVIDSSDSTQQEQKPAKPLPAKDGALKRFWKHAHVIELPTGELQIGLDKRPIRTPGGKQITLDSKHRLLAMLVAAEWDSQAKTIKPHSLSLTSLVARAQDSLDPNNPDNERAQVIDSVHRFLDTDAICFIEEDKTDILVQLQNEHWKPVVEWTNSTFGTDIRITADSLFGQPQSDTSHAILSQVLKGYSGLQLAAFERAVLATKSYLLALALTQRHLSVERVTEAAQVEVRSQIQAWGFVEDTHDVSHEDVRQQLGAAACVILGSS
ncbi:ATP12-domain-containing protein [Ramicandelaber brevisporus]|nr:ATP12-domain-containing protein [Ramicandelaber brevisporus]